jgi:hypothetical protein
MYGPLLALLARSELQGACDAHHADGVHHEDKDQSQPTEYNGSDFCGHGVLLSASATFSGIS